MAVEHEAIVGRSNIYRINPEMIIVRSGWNPRTTAEGKVDLGDVETLAADIEANGVKVPLTVYRDKETNQFVLVDGERRLAAIKLLVAKGFDVTSGVPCIIEDNKRSELERFYTALSTNTGKPLSPIEEGEAYRRLTAWGVKVAEISRRVGKSFDYVDRRLRIATGATPEVKQALENGEINLGMAKKIAVKGGDSDGQKEMLKQERESAKTTKADGSKAKSVRRSSGKTETKNETAETPSHETEYNDVQTAAMEAIESCGYAMVRVVKHKEEKHIMYEKQDNTAVMLSLTSDGEALMYVLSAAAGAAEPTSRIAKKIKEVLKA